MNTQVGLVAGQLLGQSPFSRTSAKRDVGQPRLSEPETRSLGFNALGPDPGRIGTRQRDQLAKRARHRKVNAEYRCHHTTAPRRFCVDPKQPETCLQPARSCQLLRDRAVAACRKPAQR